MSELFGVESMLMLVVCRCGDTVMEVGDAAVLYRGRPTCPACKKKSKSAKDLGQPLRLDRTCYEPGLIESAARILESFGLADWTVGELVSWMADNPNTVPVMLKEAAE